MFSGMRGGLGGILFLCASLPLAATAAVPAGFTPVALQKHTAGTYYIGAAIAGYGEVRLLVDTGSSYLVISEAILDSLKSAGTAHYTRDLEGAMADGSTRVIPVYRISALRLGDNCWVHDVEAAVFPGNTRPILGMNVLSQLAPFTFSADPPQLGLQQCQGEAAAVPEVQPVRDTVVPKTAATGVAQ